MPGIDTTAFQPWYTSFPLEENKICFSFTTYVRVRSSEVDVLTQSDALTPENGLDLEKIEVKSFSFLPKMIFDKHEEYMYLRLVEDIVNNGASRDDRTGTGTLSKFGCQVVVI